MEGTNQSTLPGTGPGPGQVKLSAEELRDFVENELNVTRYIDPILTEPVPTYDGSSLPRLVYADGVPDRRTVVGVQIDPPLDESNDTFPTNSSIVGDGVPRAFLSANLMIIDEKGISVQIDSSGSIIMNTTLSVFLCLIYYFDEYGEIYTISSYVVFHV